MSLGWLGLVFLTAADSGPPEARQLESGLVRYRETVGPDAPAAKPIIGDDAFLRRTTLVLLGRIPSLAEIEAFRANPNREALIDRLLGSSEFEEQEFRRGWRPTPP